MKIPCICIDDANRPDVIDPENWVVKDHDYHVTHVHWMVQQGVQGVELFEVKTHSSIYPVYRIDRFAFTEDNLKLLIELTVLCTELNEVQVTELIEELDLETI